MRLKDYFLGEFITLFTPLSPEECAQRINDAVGSSSNPFNGGIVGKVDHGRVFLHYRSLLLARMGKPVLVGPIVAIPNGSKIKLVYGATAGSLLYYLIWYSFIGLFAYGAIVDGRASDSGRHIEMLLGFMVMLLCPVFIHVVSTINSGQDLDEMLQLRVRETGAVVTARS